MKATHTVPDCFICHELIGKDEKLIYSSPSRIGVGARGIAKQRFFAHKDCVICQNCGSSAAKTKFVCNLPYEYYLPFGLECSCGTTYTNQAQIFKCDECHLKLSTVAPEVFFDDKTKKLVHTKCRLSCLLCSKFGNEITMREITNKKTK